MVIVLWVVTALLAVGMFLVMGALVEMYRSLEQLRRDTGLIDEPIPLEIELNTPIDLAIGLPVELLTADRAILLVVSDRCSTCDLIGEHLDGSLTEGVWLMVEPRSEGSARTWLARFGLSSEAQVIIDLDGSVSTSIGIDVTPSVLRLRQGSAVEAHTLPSARRLDDELDWLKDSGGRRASTHVSVR